MKILLLKFVTEIEHKMKFL